MIAPSIPFSQPEIGRNFETSTGVQGEQSSIKQNSDIFPSSMTISQFPTQPQPQSHPNQRKNLTWARSTSSRSSSNADQRDLEADVITFVLVGGPKWNFRIRQLNNSNRVIVSRVFKGLAEKAGLKVNDEVLCVNNVPLSDKPRSLLLSDHPEQQQHLASTLQSISGNDENKNPQVTSDQALGSDGVLAKTIADVAGGSHPLQRNPVAPSIELSKLDFAYQLIKHSSASNRLVLTIRRYRNPQQMRQFGKVSSEQNQNTSQSLSDARSSQTQAGQSKFGKTHSFGTVHYSYRCCECYCDNEGKYRLNNLKPLI